MPFLLSICGCIWYLGYKKPLPPAWKSQFHNSTFADYFLFFSVFSKNKFSFKVKRSNKPYQCQGLYHAQDYINKNNVCAEIKLQKLRCNDKHSLHILKSKVQWQELSSVLFRSNWWFRNHLYVDKLLHVSSMHRVSISIHSLCILLLKSLCSQLQNFFQRYYRHIRWFTW